MADSLYLIQQVRQQLRVSLAVLCDVLQLVVGGLEGVLYLPGGGCEHKQLVLVGLGGICAADGMGE